MSSDRRADNTTGAQPDSASFGSATLPAGARIRDYVVERFIASGGFGSVYRVRDRARDRLAALKILHPELRSLGDAFVRFLREAQVLELIRHPNIVEIYDSGSLPDGRAFMITEFLSGRDLEEQLELDGPFDLARALDILEPICDALAFAHDKGVIHRDIKASNVFLTEHDSHRRVVLLDFGLAKIIEAGGIDLTSSRMALGTPASMSPEQIRGENVDPRSDVYSLGGLVYHILTGKLPFDDKSRTVMQYMHLHGQRPRVSSRANVSPAVDEVISRAMATDRRDRYATAAEFLAALGGATGAVAAAPAAEAAPGLGLGIYLDVRVDAPAAGSRGDAAAPGPHDAPDDDPDEDALLDAMDDILAQAEDMLGARGFRPTIEGSSTVLFVRLLDRDHGAERAAAARAAGELHHRLSRHRASGVHVNLCLHAAPVQLAAGRIQGGELMHTERWAPQGALDGVVGSPDAFAGLALRTEPIPESSGRLLRLVDAGPEAAPDAAPRSPSDRAGPGATPAGPVSDSAATPAAGKSSERAMHTEMMANIGRQVAGIVHDLKSPLSVVIGNLEEVLENTGAGQALSDEDREALEDAMRAARQLMDTTATLLAASALRSYSSSTRRVIAVGALIDGAVRLSDSETKRKAEIRVACDASRHILGSQGRLTQVLVNLLVNAAQAIPEAERGYIDIHAATIAGDMVRITIRDNGIGMSDELRARIFEPFFSTKEAGEGTGLGLSQVREIIEEHGGRVFVTSTLGVGSCFTIELPAAPPDAEPTR